MFKKIMIILMMMTSVILSANIDISNIAQDYPHKESAITATVLGTPSSQWYEFKKAKGPKVKKFKAIRKVPEILRQWSDYEYGIWKQKEEAPLMILVSGTGSLYNSGLSMYIANIFYDRGYNVITFSSPTTMPYIVSQSTNNYGGYIVDESENLYNLISKAIQLEKKDGMKISKTYVGGYSLGGFQSLLIHEIDSKSKKIGIEKSLLLNSPVSILTATQKLDGFLTKNRIYNAKGLEKYLDGLFGKMLFDETITLKDMDFNDLRSTLTKFQIGEKDFEILTGLLFRLYSANMTFAGEVISGNNSTGRLGNKKIYKRFDSVTEEFHEGLSVSFDEYSKEILYPYLKEKKYPNLTLEEFINDFSLKNSEDFIKENNKNIVFITSIDDVLLSTDEVAYIENTFSNRVLIPFGGHTGLLWHRDVANLMVDKLEED